MSNYESQEEYQADINAQGEAESAMAQQEADGQAAAEQAEHE